MAVPAQSPGSARAPIAVTLDDVRTLEIHPAGDATILRVRSATPGDRIELELRFTAEGPVVRTRAAALELEAADSITARCDRFAVRAQGDIELQAGGELRCHASDAASVTARSFTVDANPGAVRLRANDDVQLLGEQVLLNCDRLPPMPEWVPPQRHQPTSLPPNAVSGDPSVIAELLAAQSGSAPDGEDRG